MSALKPDPELVRRLAETVDLPLEPGEAEELAPQLSVLLGYAELLDSLDLGGVEPAWSFALDAPEP